MTSPYNAEVDSSSSDAFATPSTSRQQSTEVDSDTRDVSASPSTSGQLNTGTDSSTPDASASSSTSGQPAVHAPLSSIEHDPNNPPPETPSPQNVQESVEMSSSSVKGSSSAPVASPSGTSKEDSDKIDVQPDETESSRSPALISQVDPTNSQEANDCCCLRIWQSCYAKLSICVHFTFGSCKKGKNVVKTIIIGLAAILLAYNLAFEETSEWGVFWECLYLPLLIIYCCFCTCVPRGRCTEEFEPQLTKRTKYASPPPDVPVQDFVVVVSEAQGILQSSSKDAVTGQTMRERFWQRIKMTRKRS